MLWKPWNGLLLHLWSVNSLRARPLPETLWQKPANCFNISTRRQKTSSRFHFSLNHVVLFYILFFPGSHWHLIICFAGEALSKFVFERWQTNKVIIVIIIILFSKDCISLGNVIKWICTPPSLNSKPRWLCWTPERNTACTEQEKVLKHTHQSQLLCAELYNVLDWPLKSINLNQYFSPICHPSFSFPVPHYLVVTSSLFLLSLILRFVFFVFLCWSFPPRLLLLFFFFFLSLRLSLLLFFLSFLSGLSSGLGVLSPLRLMGSVSARIVYMARC